MRRGVARAGLSSVALCAAMAAAGSVSTPEPARAAAARVVHVDCGARRTGDGSTDAPLRSLAEASAVDFTTTRKLLFARGSVCRGTLKITTSGSPGSPIVIGAYGQGTDPLLNGMGADAVLLVNTSDIVVQDLEMMSKGSSRTSLQNGVHLIASATTVRRVTIRRLHIHDIGGSNADEHGGVLVEGYGGTPYGKFDRLTITENHIERSAKEGIYMNAAPGDRSRPPSGTPWPRGSTRVVVTKNVMDHTGGDGILLEGTVGTLIDGNTLTYGNLAGTALGPNMRCNAGIWSGNQNDSVIQNNIVMHMQTKGCDGDAFDIDVNQDGTTIQRNVSIDNKAGFVMMCTSPPPRRAIIRNNISINDGASFQDVACVLGDDATVDGIQMYNNTFVAPSPRVAFEGALEEDLYNPGRFTFVNNIVYATKPQKTKFGCGNFCSHNVFFQIPAQGTGAVTADPKFVNPFGTSSDPMTLVRNFQLQAGSPAIGAGIAVSGLTSDFFSNPVPMGSTPSIGFHQPAR